MNREESDARVIINAADVKLRSFNTKVRVDIGSVQRQQLYKSYMPGSGAGCL